MSDTITIQGEEFDSDSVSAVLTELLDQPRCDEHNVQRAYAAAEGIALCGDGDADGCLRMSDGDRIVTAWVDELQSKLSTPFGDYLDGVVRTHQFVTDDGDIAFPNEADAELHKSTLGEINISSIRDDDGAEIVYVKADSAENTINIYDHVARIGIRDVRDE